jgi:hypothetical protein
MNRLRILSFVFGLITPYAVGIVTSHAATNDATEIVNRGRNFTEADVRGAYAFSFQGTVIELGPFAATGVVVADGKGNIINAVRTLNVNGIAVQQTFTCTYSVNPNGTGSADCSVANPLPGAPSLETFDFALEDGGRAFRLISTTPGFTAVGAGKKQ